VGHWRYLPALESIRLITIAVMSTASSA
jgi:hypothetical protein